METYIGFDSAWTNSLKARGAICALTLEDGCPAKFERPRLASFEEALDFIRSMRPKEHYTLIALDQSTVVPNLTGMRPVERVAGSLISLLGGGMQPSNRGRVGMFCDDSPIWPFLKTLGAVEDPEQARLAADGLYLMEVFPALALASFGTEFFQRNGAPKYNPARRKTYRPGDWGRVAGAAARESEALGSEVVAAWCREWGKITKPRKEDQDMLDAVLCMLIALRWRLRPRSESLLLGDLTTGYMVLPASSAVREYLSPKAKERSVPMA
jgi:predicted RNase H-like nuclease